MHEHRHVEWGAIFAGAVFAVAVSIVMLTFGTAIGLSVVSPEAGEGASAVWVAAAAAIWFIWVAISSFGAGGYIAGRLGRKTTDANADEAETRDGLHGALVWATGAIFGALLAISGVSNTLGAVSSSAGSLADTVTTAVSSAVEGGSSTLLENQGVLPSAEVASDVTAVLARAAARGEMTEADRAYLVRVVGSASNLSEEEVNSRLDALSTTMTEARDAAVDAAEKARIASVIAAFVIGATMLVSGAAAYLAAVAGGKHRDENSFIFSARR